MTNTTFVCAKREQAVACSETHCLGAMPVAGREGLPGAWLQVRDPAAPRLSGSHCSPRGRVGLRAALGPLSGGVRAARWAEGGPARRPPSPRLPPARPVMAAPPRTAAGPGGRRRTRWREGRRGTAGGAVPGGAGGGGGGRRKMVAGGKAACRAVRPSLRCQPRRSLPAWWGGGADPHQVWRGRAEARVRDSGPRSAVPSGAAAGGAAPPSQGLRERGAAGRGAAGGGRARAGGWVGAVLRRPARASRSGRAAEPPLLPRAPCPTAGSGGQAAVPGAAALGDTGPNVAGLRWPRALRLFLEGSALAGTVRAGLRCRPRT